MKKTIRYLFLFTLTLSAGSLVGFCQQKIGFFDFAGALQATNEAKREIEVVRKFVEEKNAESDAKVAEIEQIRKDLTEGARALNADALSTLQRNLQSKETQLKRFQEDTQREINNRRDAIFQKFGQKLQTLVEEYAQQNGYDAIFLLDNVEYGYVNPALNLTQQVADLYNQRNP